jgi:RNA polymerase sigma factor (sigma-70 family)
LRYCRRLLGRARAEDAVQQTFLKAYRGIREGDFELELRPWLYRIARNVAHDLLRQNGALAEPIDEVAAGSASAADELAQRERFRALVAAMRRLPSRQRRAIVGRELEGRSHADIANELGVTAGAVRQLIHRARSALRGAASAVIPSGVIARWLPGPTPSTASSARLSEALAGAGGTVGAVKIGATLAATGAIVAGGVGPSLTPDVPAPLRGSSRALVKREASGPTRAQTASTAVRRSAPSGSATTDAVTQARGVDPASGDQPQRGRGSDAAQGERGSEADRQTGSRPAADVSQTGEHQGGNSNVSRARRRPPAVAVTASEDGQQHGHSDGAPTGAGPVPG